MRILLLKLHMYAGLLTISHLGIYAIAGLTETLRWSDERTAPPAAVRYVPFTSNPAATDKEIADTAYERLRIPHSIPLPPSALQRDSSQNLMLEFYTLNGLDRVTVLEKEHRLRTPAVICHPSSTARTPLRRSTIPVRRSCGPGRSGMSSPCGV